MIVLADGFENFNTSTILRYWSNERGCSVDTSLARSGNRSLALNGANGIKSPNPYWSDYVNTNQGVVGFAFYVKEAPISKGMMLGILDDNNNRHIGIYLNANMNLVIFRDLWDEGTGGVGENSHTISIIQTCPSILRLNTWYYIELGFSLSLSSGLVQLKLNEKLEYTNSSVVTQTGIRDFHSAVLIGGKQEFTETSFVGNLDNIYVNNELVFLGDVVVETLFPIARGASIELFGSVGRQNQNHTMVNSPDAQSNRYVVDTNMRSDVPFVPPVTDLYRVNGLSSGVGRIEGVIISARHNQLTVGADRLFNHRIFVDDMIGEGPDQRSVESAGVDDYKEHRWPASHPSGEWSAENISRLQIGISTGLLA